jgi:hypothetical protein
MSVHIFQRFLHVPISNFFIHTYTPLDLLGTLFICWIPLFKHHFLSYMCCILQFSMITILIGFICRVNFFSMLASLCEYRRIVPLFQNFNHLLWLSDVLSKNNLSPINIVEGVKIKFKRRGDVLENQQKQNWFINVKNHVIVE